MIVAALIIGVSLVLVLAFFVTAHLVREWHFKRYLVRDVRAAIAKQDPQWRRRVARLPRVPPMAEAAELWHQAESYAYENVPPRSPPPEPRSWLVGVVRNAEARARSERIARTVASAADCAVAGAANARVRRRT